MPRLNMLKPNIGAMPARKLAEIGPIGGTERTRGRVWMRRRESWLLKHVACAACGRVSSDAQVDHVVPLCEGGADNETNYQTLCVECHKAKTADEARRRVGGL